MTCATVAVAVVLGAAALAGLGAGGDDRTAPAGPVAGTGLPAAPPAPGPPTTAGSPGTPDPAGGAVAGTAVAGGAVAGSAPAGGTPVRSGPGRSPPAPPPARTPSRSTGWLITVYYTAVERFHAGARTTVTGCPRLECTRGSTDLGDYPRSFVQAVRDEGTGRTAAGRYLNWSYDTGFWLDDAPRDTAGRVLRPFESAAADPTVLAAGTRFVIVACGRDDDGGAIAAPVCDRLRASRWTVADEFTPGLGGPRHLDVYLGEETSADFTEGDWYTTLHAAVIDVVAPAD